MTTAARPETRPFRFGVLFDTRDASRSGILDLARGAEDAGASVFLGTDHLGRWSSLPFLGLVAEHTALRIGTIVLNNDLRHPAVLAQELTTIDAISGGRLEIGIGAGWNKPEYDDAGLRFDPPPLRLARMRATVGMLKQAMSEGRIDHHGDDAYPPIHQAGLPRSVQRPHPPILVGGGGPRLLAYAAREAQIVGLDPRSLPQGGSDPEDVTEAAIERKVRWVREAAGDRWSELELNIIIFDVDPEFHRRRGPPPPRRRPIAEREVARSPHYLVGDAAEIVATLRERRERFGISYVAVRGENLPALAPIIRQLAGS